MYFHLYFKHSALWIVRFYLSKTKHSIFNVCNMVKLTILEYDLLIANTMSQTHSINSARTTFPEEYVQIASNIFRSQQIHSRPSCFTCPSKDQNHCLSVCL